MERKTVSSSNIAAIGYDPDTQTLEIEFLNGHIYDFKNVPLILYENLMSASSHGSFFNREISKNYPFEKIA